MSNKPITVVFLKAWRGYSKDEVAGFAPEEAERLVDNDVAEYKGKPPAKKKPSASSSSSQGASEDESGASGANAPALDAGDDNEGKP